MPISFIIILKAILKGGRQMDIRTGDIITMKKQHPCGSKKWKILRIGADFRMECCGCGHIVMLPRAKAEKNIKNIERIDV